MSNIVDFPPPLDRDNAMTQADLEAMASGLAPAKIEELDTPSIERLLTFGQYLTDRCLAEYERRGALRFLHGVPELPYLSDHSVPSVLTR